MVALWAMLVSKSDQLIRCAWMCHLSVPAQPPPSIPQKYPKVVFGWFLHVFGKMLQKDRKIRPKSAQSLIASYVKKVVLRRYASFFRHRRAWMCHLSVPWQPPPQVVLKKIWPPKNVSSIAGSYVKQSVLRFCCSFFRTGKGGKKPNHPNVVHVLVPPGWKKVVLAAVFIFLGQDVPGCAILVFPGNPPSIPQKYPKVVFGWFLHVFGKMLQKDRKIRPKSAQSLITSYVKKVVLRRYASFFRHRRAWMCHLNPS